MRDDYNYIVIWLYYVYYNNYNLKNSRFFVLISKLDSIELTRCLGSRQTMMAFIFDDDELRNISTFFAGKPQFLGGEIPGFHKKLRFHRHGLFLRWIVVDITGR